MARNIKYVAKTSSTPWALFRIATIVVGFFLHKGLTIWTFVHLFFPIITWIKWLIFDFDKLTSLLKPI